MVEEEGELSLCVAVGLTSSASTIKILGYARKVPLMILIDSGSTHSFVSSQVIKILKLPIQPCYAKLKVTVANGQVMYTDSYCPNFKWQMQEESFQGDIRLMKVGSFDMVLGMDWVDSFAPVVINTRPHSLSFFKEERLVTLFGFHEEHKVLPTEGEKLLKLLNKQKFGDVSVVCTLESSQEGTMHKNCPQEVHSLLQSFQKVFEEPQEFPPHRTCDHLIPLQGGAQSFSLRPYRYSFDQKNAIEKIINDMLISQTVVPSHSCFASPALLVKNKNCTWRLCVDYRRLNSLTIKNKYPIPMVEDLLDELKGSKVFSKVDLRSGYHQVRMKEEDEQKTTFRTHHGLWKFMVMPFGLTNTPATFQSLMYQVFEPHIRKFILVFFMTF